MGHHRRPAHRLLSVEAGSAIIEGTAALGVAFLLLTLIVQVGTAAAAREAAQGAVAATARRAARPAAELDEECRRLVILLETTVPGATEINASVTAGPTHIVADAEFRWIPPGPDWTPIKMRVAARVPIVVPP